MKNKNNNQNEFERLGSQKSGGGDISPLSPPPPGSATGCIVPHFSPPDDQFGSFIDRKPPE